LEIAGAAPGLEDACCANSSHVANYIVVAYRYGKVCAVRHGACGLW